MLLFFSHRIVPLHAISRVVRLLPWLALLAFNAVHASSTCYSGQDFPAIGNLEPTKSGYRVVLSGVFREHSTFAPSLEFSSRTGWQKAGQVPCKNGRCDQSSQLCSVELPEIHLSNEDAQRMLGRNADEFEQKVSACVEQGQYEYFGIGFYRGEGSDGVGGVGRYDKRTGKMEIRRPKLLLETSITHLAYDGKYLWIGTGNQYECEGVMPTEGLLRYDWDSDQITKHDAGQDEGMCGFNVNAFLVRDGALIVASDLGLSVRERSNGTSDATTWHHYVPDLQDPKLMRETTCHKLYEHLLRTVDRKEDCCGWSSYSQLNDALKNRDPEFLEKYIRSGAKPEVSRNRTKPLRDGRTALIEAVQAGQTDTVKALVDEGAKVNAADDNGLTALDYADTHKDKDIVQILVTHGADVNAMDKSGWNILMKTAYSGQNEIVDVLLENGADVNARNNDGSTALMVAAKEGRTDVVDTLLAHGANVNLKDKHSMTALDIATSMGHPAIAQAILAKAGNSDFRDSGAYEALVSASRKGQFATVEALLAMGIDINEISSGDSALTGAAGYGQVGTVQLLLAKGANPNANNAEGWNALMLATLNGHTETVKALLSGGANVNGHDATGMTALMLATVWGNIEIVRTLLANGANVNQSDNNGRTALSIAQEKIAGITAQTKEQQKNRLDIIPLLRQAGAKK